MLNTLLQYLDLAIYEVSDSDNSVLQHIFIELVYQYNETGRK